MADRLVEDLPLRDVFTEAERLGRELIDHLDNGFLPQVRALVELVEVSDAGVRRDDVEDVTIRNQAAKLLDRARFADDLYARFDRCVIAIEQSVSRITSGE